MIDGTVNEALEPIIAVTIFGRNGAPTLIDAAIDTGFNDRLAISKLLIDCLDLRIMGHATVILGDGAEAELSTFQAEILWGSDRITIPVLETGGAALIGTELLRGARLTIDFRPGGAVSIVPLS